MLATLTAAVTCAATAAAVVPAQGAPRGPRDETQKVSGAAPATKAERATGEKLGGRDRQLLSEAAAKGRQKVTVMVAASSLDADRAAAAVRAVGGRVEKTFDSIGYVRATVPVAAVERLARSSTVKAIDLKATIKLDDPRPQSVRAASSEATAVPGPGPSTPDDNPYMPTNETGVVDFKKAHPAWDGRRITIGIVDTGVDLDHPALARTSTGARKVVDWVTGTDPVFDGDFTWRAMVTEVIGPTFVAAGATWTAPAGTFRFNRFSESVTAGSEIDGDVNRDGDTDDRWGILYDPETNDIWVDTDQDRDFTDEALMRPYRERFDVGHFGTDDPNTTVSERMPFVVEFREDVDASAAGLGTVDFVNIGIVSDAHGTHVAGIAAANGMFGGNMDGAAPGARIVSSRACLFNGGCTNVALTEGMADVVINRKVDVVNMSIGGLPALNDGANARAELYNRLISRYGVQLVISAGNSGPGINTVGDPSVATDVVSVASSISKESWLANYGSVVAKRMGLHNFSSRGPREDGGFKPTLSAPGSAVSTVPIWQEGSPVPEAGYDLPPGYAMFNGTSMASPQAAGATAVLLSATRARGIAVTPAQLRTALMHSANWIPGEQAVAQGAGLFDTVEAYSLLVRKPVGQGRYKITSRICTEISGFLSTVDRGPGIYNRCAANEGGHAVGQARTYWVYVTRNAGPAAARYHAITWQGNDGTFSSPSSVMLERGKTVIVKVTARPRTSGLHSAVMRINDMATIGIDAHVMTTIAVGTRFAAPSYTRTVTSSVQRNSTKSYFVTVPEGTKTLQVIMSGIATGSQTRFIGFHPYGLPVESTSSLACYTNFSNAADCNPVSRAYTDPTPGVWEFEVESRRTTPFLNNPFQLSFQLQGVEVQPEVLELTSVVAGQPTPVQWQITNEWGPVTVTPQGGPLASAFSERGTVGHEESVFYEVQVPAAATEFTATIGNPSDLGADLDLYVYRDSTLVAFDADGDSEESVTITDPQAGTYTVEVFGYAVPAGTTRFDYVDSFTAPSLGSLDVDSQPIALSAGESATVSGTVTARQAPAAGRVLRGEMELVSGEGAVVGGGAVVIRSVTGGAG